jgi:hypothetical protein
MSTDKAEQGQANMQDNVELRDNGAAVIRGHNVDIREGGAMMITGENIHIREGGAALVVGNTVSLQEGGGGILLAKRANFKEGTVILLGAREVSGDIKVLINLKAAVLLGIVFGLTVGLVRKLFGR